MIGSSATSTSQKKSKLGGLGAKKAVTPIDFAEAERKAAEDAERIKQLGYDRQREEEEERAQKEVEKLAASQMKAKAADTAVKASTVQGKVDLQKGNSQDLERLGMGFRKLGFGAVPTASSASSTRSRYIQISFRLSVELIYLPTAHTVPSLMTHPPPHAKSLATKKLYLLTCTLAERITTRLLSPSLKLVCRISKVLHPYPPTNTLVAMTKKSSNVLVQMAGCWAMVAFRVSSLLRKMLWRGLWPIQTSRTSARAFGRAH